MNLGRSWQFPLSSTSSTGLKRPSAFQPLRIEMRVSPGVDLSDLAAKATRVLVLPKQAKEKLMKTTESLLNTSIESIRPYE